MDYQSSFKIRALVQQLRPHVLEVLHTPDFRSCNGADEIRRNFIYLGMIMGFGHYITSTSPSMVFRFYKLKLLMDLYKEITLETHKQGKAVSEYQLPPHKRAKLLHPSYKPVDKAVQGNPSKTTCFSSDKKHSGLQGSYIVGGSAFGMNFITFTGSKPSYYGVTKESFRSSHKKF